MTIDKWDSLEEAMNILEKIPNVIAPFSKNIVYDNNGNYYIYRLVIFWDIMRPRHIISLRTLKLESLPLIRIDKFIIKDGYSYWDNILEKHIYNIRTWIKE